MTKIPDNQSLLYFHITVRQRSSKGACGQLGWNYNKQLVGSTRVKPDNMEPDWDVP